MLVHPPAEVVTVTVYVPVALTRGFAVVLPEMIPGPAQLKVAPPVDELAESVTDVVVHVSVPPVALAPGGVHAALGQLAAIRVEPTGFQPFVTASELHVAPVGQAVVPSISLAGGQSPLLNFILTASNLKSRESPTVGVASTASTTT